MRKLAFFLFPALMVPMIFLADAHSAENKKSNVFDEALLFPLRGVEGLTSMTVDLGNIFVGGKRLSSPFGEFVWDSVSSTSVVTRRDILQSGAENIPDALREVPGIIFTDLAGNGQEPAVDLRGFNEGADIVYMMDGVRLNEPKSNNMNFALIPMSMVERIEISRGGSSFLYGEGAVAGAVNFTGRVVREEGIDGAITSRIGSFGEWGETFEVGVKKDSWDLYLTGDLYHTRGFRQNTSVEKETFYLKTSRQLSDRMHAGFSYLHGNAHLDRSGSIRETYLRLYGREATERPRNFADLESDLGVIDFSWIPVDDLAVTGNFFFRQTSELSVANFATFETSDNELDLETDSKGFTVQAEHSREIPWQLKENFLIGADYGLHEIDEEDYNRSKSTLQRLAQTVDTQSEKESGGLFSKLSISHNERAGIYYGIRYDGIGFENNDRINTANNEGADVSKWSQSVGVSYQILEPLSASVTYSHSFKAPTLSDLYANPLFGGNPVLKPEESSDYQAGLRWSRGPLLWKGSLFMIRRVNEIGFDPNLTDADHPYGRNNNLGKTQRVGIENFLECKPLAWMKWRVSHAYTEAIFKSNTTSFSENEISGDSLPMVPLNRWTSSVLVQPLKNMELYLDMVSISKQVLINDLTNDRNGRRLPAWTVFNFRVIQKIGKWEVTAEIDNLLDEQYETGGSVGASPSSFNTDKTVEENFYSPAPGRSFGLSARLKF